MRRPLLYLFVSGLMALAAQAAPIGPIPLWKGAAPGDKGSLGPEHDTTTDKDRIVAGRRVVRITNVSVPTLTVYPAAKAGAAGPAILVFPGGGYRIVAWDLEGTEVCEWLNATGVTCVLVKYRVPAREGQPPYVAPLQDAQRAVGMVRAHSKEWGIDPQRIGVLGFSAGAHLSATLSNNFAKRSYDRVDEADDASCRPDFALLIYPGGMVRDGKLGPEAQPGAGTPPTFLVQTEDDPVHVENSLAYYAALKEAKVPAEMHLYPTGPAGGHGYGLRPSPLAAATWPARATDWLRSLGVLGPANN
ncbi:MAG: alpha/beta hydrolase [Bryobacteraceae bacterium]|jgi:acetyl esterase/lipase